MFLLDKKKMMNVCYFGWIIIILVCIFGMYMVMSYYFFKFLVSSEYNKLLDYCLMI